MRSPASRIFLNGDIVLCIIDCLPRPTLSEMTFQEAPDSKAARLDLFHLACTSTDFFYPAMEAAWSVTANGKQLLDVLHAGVSEPQPGPGISIADIERESLRYVSACFPHNEYVFTSF